MRCGCDIPQGSNPGAGRVYSRDVARFGVILAMELAWVAVGAHWRWEQYGSLLTPSAAVVSPLPASMCNMTRMNRGDDLSDDLFNNCERQ